MATDNRGHTVPASTGHPARADVLALSLSTCDVVPVTNATTRATAVTNLGATTAKPLIVARADARTDSILEESHDAGVTWRTVVLGSGISSYTPVVTAPTTSPTLGTGSSVAGSYYTLGPWVIGTFDIAFGTSGVVVGSGVYEISLPIAAVAGGASAGTNAGSGEFVDASPLTTYTGVLSFQSTTTVRLHYSGGSTGLSSGAPVAPAANDKIHGTFMYLGA